MTITETVKVYKMHLANSYVDYVVRTITISNITGKSQLMAPCNIIALVT